MPLGPALPSPATLLFNHPTRGIMPIVDRLMISLNNDDEHYKALAERQTKMIGIMILPEIISIWSTVAVQWEDSDR